MKCDFSYLFYGILCLIGFIILGFILFQFHIFVQDNYIFTFHPTNTNLEIKAKEYNDYVNTFYKFNISNVDYNLNDTELIEQGGVCWQYSEFYKRLAEKDNITATLVVFPTNTTLNISHEIAILSDNDGYCVEDGVNYMCIEFI